MLPFEERDGYGLPPGKRGEPNLLWKRWGCCYHRSGAVGRVSVKFNPLNEEGVGLVIVNVRVETPPAVVGSGLKFFEMVTAAGSRI
jgi:hypothetical protein